MKKETLDSVALKAGVSKTTVCRVLAGNARKYRISQKTEAIVKRAASECGYTSRPVAKCMRGKKARVIALVVPSISEFFFASLASSVFHYCSLAGFTTVVAEVSDHLEGERKQLEDILSRDVSGLVIAPSSDIGQYLEMVDKEIPVVQIDRFIAGASISSVCSQNFLIGQMLTNILIENGHRSIACLDGPREISTISSRVDGYLDAMGKAGLEPRLFGGTFDSQEAFFCSFDVLKSTQRPTAILSLANGQALGVMGAAEKLGLKIPKDLSLVTVDDNKYMKVLSPQITRISQPIDQMAQLSCNYLFKRIQEPSLSLITTIALHPALIKGESVCPPRI